MLSALAHCVLPIWSRLSRPPVGACAIAEAQRRILKRLLARHADLPFGRRCGYLRILNSSDPVAAFRAAVPPSDYADWRELIERTADGERDALIPGRAVALAQTSGTTSGAKAGERWIPQNRALLRHHRRGGAAALARLLDSAGAQVLEGRLLFLSGSTTLDRSRSIPSGDLSGICAGRLPRWIAGRYEPGAAIATESDWRRRLDLIVGRCTSQDVRLLSGIPSWMLILLQAVRERAGRAVAEAWPNFHALMYGGHAIEPFIAPLREHLLDDTRMMEVYTASECFIAIGERAWRLGDAEPAGLELLTDHGAFLEFAPDGGGEAVGAEQIESGGLYRVLVTTPGGLARYQIGDLVLGRGPGRCSFAGRTHARISIFGEHVEGYHLAGAIAEAARATAANVAHYHVAPVLPTKTEPRGCHEWLVEFIKSPADADSFAAAIDRALCARVIDYAAHRAQDIQLLPPIVTSLPTGTFSAYLAANGRFEAQRKVPEAWPDRTVADDLLKVAEFRSPNGATIP
jgi:hypothetical protein